MTKDEALKLALEVLKRIDEATPTAMAKLVIPEIEQVLAQPEHIGFMDSKLNPIERTWVGLKDEEISASSKGNMTRNGFARTIEAKLKEKNR
jgi:hypothetical protein